MRKVLLAGAAIGAIALADAPEAYAQRAEFPQPYAPANAGPALRTTPGVTVRLAGRYRFYAGYIDQDLDSDAAGNKLDNYDFFDYARLWTGFDGFAENGLQYGATLEIRMGSGSASRGDDRGNLRYRRMYGYVGTPTMGQLRVGSGQVQAVELMHTGHMNGKYGTGLWDGDAPAMIIGPSSVSNNFWFSASSGNNNTAIGYYSPQFYGFDFGVSYSPNNGNFGGDGSCSSVGTSCDRLSDSTSNAGTIKPTDIFDIMARYRGTFGGVGIAASGGYRGSSTVDAVGNANAFDGLSVGLVGVEASVAGFTFGGNLTWGTGNYGNGLTGAAGGLTPLAKKTTTSQVTVTDNDDLFGWQIGAGYRFGAFSVGLSYGEYDSEGSQTVSSDRSDKLFGIGGSYAVAPGFNLFADYLYGERKETGWDFATGTAGTQNNKVDVSLFIIGTAFNW